MFAMKFLKSRFSILNLAIVLASLITTATAGPVSHFGALKVCSNNICGEKTGSSVPVLLKGPSLYWSDGSGTPFYNLSTVDWFVDNMQIGVIRAAMGIQYYEDGTETMNKAGGVSGYYYNAAGQKSYIKAVIDAAILNDIYVIVDWHSHNAHQNTEPNLAKEFFKEMATEYKDVPNIIWEVYNEPVNASAAQITSYANGVITEIRNAGNNNLVLVGSRYYSQNPEEQASNYGNTASSKNVAFTFHFYAGTHTYSTSSGIAKSAIDARTAGYAVFGSEWGAVNANGGGNVNSSASDSWTTWMDGANISNCMWNASSLDEGSSMFAKGTNSSDLSESNLTTSGKYFQTYMGKNKWTDKIPTTHPKGKDFVANVNDGSSVTLTSAQLELTGDITEVSQPENGEVSFTTNSITYTTSSRGSPNAKERFIYKVTRNNITIQSKIMVNINNRGPILPEIAPIAVSRRVSTSLSLASDLRVSDPNGAGAQLMQASISPASAGTISYSSGGSTISFTPDASMYNTDLTEATLSYTARSGTNNSLTNSASVVLQIRNIAPTIRSATANTVFTQVSNTEPVGLGMSRFLGSDPDGDSIWFVRVYLDPQYPGELIQVKPDSFVYNPEPNRTGQVVFLAIITDGSLNSPVGKAQINLIGDGTAINATHPTVIPDDEDPPDNPPDNIAIGSARVGDFGLNAAGFGNIAVNFSHSGYAKLDVYSLSGKKMGTLLSGWQNAGSSEVSLKNLGLQKGIYILRLKQGSQVKTLRIVN